MSSGKGPKGPEDSDEDKFWQHIPKGVKAGPAGVPGVAPVPVRALEDTSGLDTIFQARDDVRAAALELEKKMAATGGGGGENDPAKDSVAGGGGSDSAAGDAGEEEDFSLPIDESGLSPEARLFPSNPLDIKVDGEITLGEKIKPLNKFWRERASGSHDAAQDKLLEFLPDLRKVSLPVDASDSPKASRAPDPLNSARLRAKLNEKEPLYFYRSTAKKITREQMAAVRHLGQRIEGYWRREHSVLLQAPPAGILLGRMIELALECPRMLLKKFSFKDLGLEYLDELVAMYPQCAVLFQIVFSHLSQHILAKRRKYPYHREAYALHQTSTSLAKRAGGLDGLLSDAEIEVAKRFFQKFCRGESFSDDEKMVIRDFVVKVDGPEVATLGEGALERRLFTAFAPSLALFDQFTDSKKIKEFIDARFSLLLPTRKKVGSDENLFEGNGLIPQLKKVVQEDFITYDLIALARAKGVYDEHYKGVFEALAYHRQLQFFIDVHLDPHTPDKSRMFVALLLYSISKESGRKSTVSSFGCGNKLLERILLGHGDVSRIDAVDKHKGAEGDKTEEIGSKFRAVSIPIPPEGENSIAFRERVLGALPSADVVMAADSLHETSNPKYYLIKLFRDKVKSGGYLYVSDPIHCRAVDEQTKDTVNIYDNTDFPASMLSLEDYLEVLCYLSAIGAEVVAINIIPGAYAGYGDGLARLSFVLKKLPEEEMPYKIPADTEGAIKGEFLKEDKDIFEVFPLNLIPEDQRERVLDIIWPDLIRDPLNKIEFAEVRSFVIARFLKLGEPVTAEATGFRGRIQHTLFSPISTLIKGRPSFRGHAGVRQHLVENRYLPYPVEQLLKIAGEPNDELRTRNRTAGDVIALWQLLIETCQIDITDELRKQRGWKYFI